MRIVGGELAGRRFGAPGGRGTRPTADRVREALASALAARDAFAGAQVLDLFAGTGGLSFEAISRGASSAVLVDSDPGAIREMTKSARSLGIEESLQIVRMDLARKPSRVVAKLPTPPTGFDLVFADAPYEKTDIVTPLLAALVVGRTLASGALVVVEHATSHAWQWCKGLAHEADYRYGQTSLSFGVYQEKGPT